MEQQCCKNWLKTFLHPSNPPSNKGMNLIDLPPLTKRQQVWYLPKKTLEACQWHEELAREMGVAAVGGGNPCERYMDFRILCIPQNLPWVFFCSISLLLANFYSHATSCAPCVKAKAACKPFDVDKAHAKARVEAVKKAKRTISLAQAKDVVPGLNCILKSLWGWIKNEGIKKRI